MNAAQAPRERALSLARRHGFNATAFQTLEEGYDYAFVGADACVAYVDTGRAWVAAGAPIAATADLAEAAALFVELARRARRRCCFFAVESRFVGATPALGSLRIGEQPVWDPGAWSAVLEAHRSLREQLRRARAKGVTVREAGASELRVGAVRAGLERLTERWSATRRMAPMGFLVSLPSLGESEHRRRFVAEREGRVVGVASVVPVPARAGAFLEHVLRDPKAPNGTSELLVDAVMTASAAAGQDWLTLGLAPLAGDVAPALRLARRSSSFLYDFEGLRAYKAKLRPARWDPLFLSYPRDQGAMVTLFDVLSAFTTGGFVRFGLRSLLRGSTAVLGILAVLLVPWIAILALAPAERWFYSPAIKWSWVGFDLALVLALSRALRRPTVRAYTALAVVVSLDALVTTLQAVLWNAPQASRIGDWIALGLGCCAPALAAVVLWGARARLLRLDASC